MTLRTAFKTVETERVEIVHSGVVQHSEAADREALWRGLRQALPTINSKYFYDDHGSKLFEDITRLPEYYQTRTEEALLEVVAEELIAVTEPDELVELGSGAGRKIRILLDAMQRRGGPLGCVLLDVNRTFLETSALGLAQDYPGLAVRGVVGDFLRDLAILGAGGRRLFLFFAGTIGNLHPDRLPAFLSDMRAVMEDGDHFLVGVDQVKDRARLEAAYNDRAGITAAFNRNILHAVNRRFGTDFEPGDFEHVAFWDAERQWIEMRLRARRDARVTLGRDGGVLHLPSGTEIRTEISCKFTRATFTERLRGSGLALSRWFSDPQELFALALLRPV